MAILFWIVFILGLGGAYSSKFRSELRHIQTKVDLMTVDIVGFRSDLEDLANYLNATNNKMEELANAVGNFEVSREVGESSEDETDTDVENDLKSRANKKSANQMFQTLERKLDYVMNGVKDEKYSSKHLIEQAQESVQTLAKRVVALEEQSNTLSAAFLKIQDIESKEIDAMQVSIQELSNKFESLQSQGDEKFKNITERIQDITNKTLTKFEDFQQQIGANSNEIHELNATLYGKAEAAVEVEKVQNQKRLEQDCYGIKKNDASARSGVYEVMRGDGGVLSLYCDMDTDGGGWTVFQNRFDGSVDFYKDFEDYVKGFGNINEEFWLGLVHIYAMTKATRPFLRIELEDASGNTAYQTYTNFYLTEGPAYRLKIGHGSGTAGDHQGLSYNKDQPFSTKDNDQGGRGCPAKDQGGWWFKNCAYANLNGKYETPGTESSFNSGEGGMTYRQFAGKKSLKKARMMFRPA